MSSKTVKEQQKLTSKLNANYALGENQRRKAGVVDEDLGAVYYKDSEAEKRQQFKREYVKKVGQKLDKNQVPYIVSEGEIDLAYEKERGFEQYAFEKWLAASFPPNHPIYGKLVREWFPGFYDKREELIDDQLMLQKRAAMIKLFGPRSKDDILFMYSINKGDLKVPDEPVHLDNAENAYNRGLYSRRRDLTAVKGIRSVVDGNWGGIPPSDSANLNVFRSNVLNDLTK